MGSIYEGLRPSAAFAEIWCICSDADICVRVCGVMLFLVRFGLLLGRGCFIAEAFVRYKSVALRRPASRVSARQRIGTPNASDVFGTLLLQRLYSHRPRPLLMMSIPQHSPATNVAASIRGEVGLPCAAASTFVASSRSVPR